MGSVKEISKYSVSIVVPVYRVPERYLRKCIESIQNQTLNDIEIVLVDDGSPDNCGNICDEYAEKDERIITVHKENGGLSSARNAGQRVANGKYLMFVDGDDWIENDMCEELYSIALKTGVDLVMCGMSRDYAISSEKYNIGLENLKIYKGDECKILQSKVLDFNCGIAFAYSKLISKSILDNYCIFHDEKLKQGAEDVEFNIRLFDKLKSATFTNRSFYHYMYNENSISSASTDENNQYVVNCFRSIFNFINVSDNRELLIPWFYNRFLYAIITTAISGYFHPDNKLSLKKRIEGFKDYLNIPLVQQTLKYKNTVGLSTQRIFVLFLIEHRLFYALELLGILRKWQKMNK